MATKFNRETEIRERVETRRTPWMRQGPPPGRMSRRQRIFIIIMGLVLIGVLSQLAYRLNHNAAYNFQQIQRGVGVIVERDESDMNAEVATLRIGVAVGDVEPLVAEYPMEAPYWQALDVGDHVAILYRLDKSGTHVQLMECGMVALPD